MVAIAIISIGFGLLALREAKKYRARHDTVSRHIRQAGSNVFADLGFPPQEAAALQERSKKTELGKLSKRKT